jgi:RNase P/RNase MRP subunit POP5
MKEPEVAILSGRLLQAHEDLGSVRKAAAAVGMPYASAWRWLHKQGQPHVYKERRLGSLSALVDTATYDLLGEYTAARAAVRLYQDGRVPRVLHRSSIIRAARRHADLLGVHLRYSSGPPKKDLSQKTKEKRLAFATHNLETNWKLTLFTDRKKFSFKYPGTKVGSGKWLKGSEEHVACQVNHAGTVNIYAGLSPYGLTLAHEVAGTRGLATPYKSKKGQYAKNITSAEYAAVLEKTLLPGGTRLFSQGAGQASWVFQQDNDPSHLQAISHLKAWNSMHGSSIRFMQGWPPNSPDLNPLENVWGWMEARINELGCDSWADFKAAVHRICREVPQTMVDNLYGSMNERMQLVIEKGGGKTGY